MTYYLYAQTACAVKIDGNFVGTTDGNYFAFEADEYLLEVIPLDDRMLPVAFLVKNEPRKTPSLSAYPRVFKAFRNGFQTAVPRTQRIFLRDACRNLLQRKRRKSSGRNHERHVRNHTAVSARRCEIRLYKRRRRRISRRCFRRKPHAGTRFFGKRKNIARP